MKILFVYQFLIKLQVWKKWFGSRNLQVAIPNKHFCKDGLGLSVTNYGQGNLNERLGDLTSDWGHTSAVRPLISVWLTGGDKWMPDLSNCTHFSQGPLGGTRCAPRPKCLCDVIRLSDHPRIQSKQTFCLKLINSSCFLF